MKQLRTVIPRTNITFPAKRTDRNSVFVQSGQIITVTPIHVSNPFQFGWENSRENWDKWRGQQSLDQFFSSVELGHYDVHTCQQWKPFVALCSTKNARTKISIPKLHSNTYQMHLTQVKLKLLEGISSQVHKQAGNCHNCQKPVLLLYEEDFDSSVTVL